MRCNQGPCVTQGRQRRESPFVELASRVVFFVCKGGAYFTSYRKSQIVNNWPSLRFACSHSHINIVNIQCPRLIQRTCNSPRPGKVK